MYLNSYIHAHMYFKEKIIIFELTSFQYAKEL
jgi:hypothetical protein